VLWEASRVHTLLLNLGIKRLVFESINGLHMSNAYQKSLAPIKKNRNNSLKLGKKQINKPVTKY
jgi:hypothetical protein